MRVNKATVAGKVSKKIYQGRALSPSISLEYSPKWQKLEKPQGKLKQQVYLQWEVLAIS